MCVIIVAATSIRSCRVGLRAWVEHNLTVTFTTLFVVLSLQSPCSAVVCGNNGRCVALYKENSYICLCKEGFTGRNCETGKIVPYMLVILDLYDESEHC